MEDVGEERRPGSDDPGFDSSRPVESFSETVRQVVLEPAGFFSRITGEERAWPPIAFAIICGVISLVLGFAVELLVPVDFGPLGGPASGLLEGTGQLSGAVLVAIAVGVIVLSPLFILIGLYIGSFIYQVLIRLIVGRENAGYWATFKIYAYTGVVSLLSWIPVVGILATFYGYYLIFVAVREAHSTTTVRAAIMTAIPFLFFLGSFVLGVINLFTGGQGA